MPPLFSQPVVCPVLVGRDTALSNLRSQFERCADRGRVVLVSGEAGVGKSRLVAELCTGVRAGGGRVVMANFYEQDTTSPYSAFARVLADPGWASGPDWQLLAPFASDLAAISPELATRTGGGGPGDQDKQQVMRAATRFFRTVGIDRPTLLAFEDLHWGDGPSLELIAEVARDAAPGCLLLLTFRDDETSPALDALLAELDRERRAAEVALPRLGVGGVDQMLRAILGSAHSTRADLLHMVFGLTGGNPFFVEEVVRAYLDQAGSEGLTGQPLPDFDVPRGVNEAVHRRTRTLSDEAQRLLSLAAIAGVRFEFPLLRDLSGHSEEDLLRLMKELVAAQLVVEEREDAFAFRHALTREAIRSELLVRERRTLSRQIGEAIERLHGDDVEGRLEDLAWHFYEAGEWQRASIYASRAGARALALYAPAAALVNLTKAIEAGERTAPRPSMGEVFRLRGSAHEALGNFDLARSDYERAAAEADAAGDTRTHWRAFLDLGSLWAARDYAQSEPHYRAALTLAREQGDPVAVGYSLQRLGNWYSNAGDFEAARGMQEEALALLREAGDTPGIARTLDLLGMTCYLAFHLGAGAAYYREALPLLEAADDRQTLSSALATIQFAAATYQTDAVPPAMTLAEGSAFGERGLLESRQSGSRAAESYALWQLAFSLGPQGQFDRGLACALEALEIAREIGHMQWETASECALGALLTGVLAPDRALGHLENAQALAEKMGSRLWMTQVTALRLDALLCAGDAAAAAGLATGMVDAEPSTFGLRQLLASSADVALASGDLGRASAMLGRLEQEGERSGTGRVAPRLARLRGRVLAANGKLDEAVATLQEAGPAAEAHGHCSLAWRIQADLAHLLLVTGHRADARAAATWATGLVDAIAANVSDPGLRAQFVAKANLHLPAMLRRQARGDREGLTAREAEVVALLAGGRTNREIADRLVLSVRTVESHVANAMSKLECANRAQLVGWAIAHGVVTKDS